MPEMYVTNYQLVNNGHCVKYHTRV